MSQKISEWETTAAECRDLARLARSDKLREELLEIADQFDRIAAARRRSLKPAAPRAFQSGAIKPMFK